MTDNITPPAGWYPDPSGAPGNRWWSGTEWKDDVQPVVEPAAEPAKRPWFKRKAIIIPVAAVAGVIFLSGAIASANGGADPVDKPAAVKPADKPADKPSDEEKIKTVEMVSLEGMTVAEARVVMDSFGLVLVAPDGAADDWIITTQSQRAGALALDGSTVTVNAAAPEGGTLAHPFPAGYVVSVFQGSEDNTLANITAAVKDWNAGAAIAQANQFNDPAQPGYHYVAVEYTVTGANKTEPADVSMLMYDWTLAQTDGTLIAESNSVVMPDDWNQTYDLPDLYEGQSGSFVIVYQVPDAYTGALLAQAYGKYLSL
jgi:hypothetical protein